MAKVDSDFRRRLEALSTTDRNSLQLQKFNALLEKILPQNTFYAQKLKATAWPLKSLQQLADFPTTTKRELQQPGGYAANRTYPLDHYVRFHRTSGTQGKPVIVVDTAEDWQWWCDTWQYVLDAAHIEAADRVLMAFSFGPFIGFWSAHDAVTQRGAMSIPAGGLSSEARLELLISSGATAMCCTPSYALRLAEVAEQAAIDLRNSEISRIIVAGEPGGSIPAVRQRIEEQWRARVIDHSGATEVGPWGYADPDNRGLHVVESEFIAEFLALNSPTPAGEGELSELVITTLGRAGAPVIRYRTGDLVRPTWAANRGVLLEGGVLGRTDDMIVIRGVNIFPSAVEQIIRTFPEVTEYRITARRGGTMDALAVEVEDRLNDPARIAQALHLRLGLHVDVTAVDPGSLPRFEAKAKRFVDLRNTSE